MARRILFLFVFGLCGLAILLALGSWQLRRLAWKEAVLAEIESRIAADPVPLPAAPDRQDDRYLPVRVTGTIEDGEILVLVSVKQVGPGYRIIAPLKTEDGRLVLLDRGFVPDDQRDALRAGGAADVIGNLHWPRETDSYTPAPDARTGTWFARDVDAMAQALGTEPVLIVAKSPTGEGVTPMPVDSARIPNDHLQYAITWFSLALIWAAMTAYFLWRTRAKETS